MKYLVKKINKRRKDRNTQILYKELIGKKTRKGGSIIAALGENFN